MIKEKIRRFIKQQIKKVLTRKGLKIVPIKKERKKETKKPFQRSTNLQVLQSLINSLKPYNTNYPLKRLGREYDGGYLVPDDLDGIAACFSPGVSKVFSFEEDCAKLGMNIFMVDKSIERPEELPDEFGFIQKFIGPMTNEEFITMDDWVNRSIPETSSDLMLQMDIEGAEYFSIINMSDGLLKRFRIIVVEFHYLHLLWNHHFFKTAEIAFKKLLQHHTCVHIHPNNGAPIYSLHEIDLPKVAEFTFLRKDRIVEKSPCTQFPHPLDNKNLKRKDIVVLPEIWYK